MATTDLPAPDERGYRRVIAATKTYREELVVRLAGEVGLRPREMAHVRIGDGREYDLDGVVHTLLLVANPDGERLAYVPRDLWDDLAKYARERDRAENVPILDVSARRIQMIIREVGDRVDGLSVSSRSLRQSFARRSLDQGVDPRVVSSVGGWSSLDTVIGTLDRPDERAIVRSFAENGSSGSQTPDTDGQAGRHGPALNALLTTSSALESAASREEVETAACEALVDAGYDVAWIVGVRENGQEPDRRAWAGVDGVEGVPPLPSRVDATGSDPATETGVRVGRVRDVNTNSGPTSSATVAEIPIGHGETAYGTLAVATSPSADVAERERAVLADLGRRVGHAIAAITHRRLLRADTVVELEFHTTDERSFLVETARECECSFELEGQAPVAERRLVLYVEVSGTAPETIVDRARESDGVARARLIRSSGDDAVVELVVSGESVASTLTEYGGNVTAYSVDGEGGAVTAEFPTDIDVRGVVGGVTSAFPDTEFVAKREAPHAVSSPPSMGELATVDLTEKQRSVLRAAYLAGYFDWPRGTTAEELADTLDISSPTLHNHLRKAQRSVLDELFEERPE